ncbi:acyl-CoA thioesterase [Vacuolonema iberomarrocanum]|uniref:acyl-CoA thioesterase n=1 Tax=Vacuolonema iberomarrocanum TaxID=3454632 RepID=UPI001A06A4E9|nr:acyl-CoA thioesterase [filamentous cyanobacterium LEGE 07170]
MQPQLDETHAIQQASQVPPLEWFEYPVQAFPHNTDYGGVVWHGAYLTWLEEARVEYLRSLGVRFSDLVAMGCDLPVVELTTRYHRPLQMGESAILRARMQQMNGVRLVWDYQLVSPDGQTLYLTAQVTLVTVDREKGKIMRQLPPAFQDVLTRLASPGNKS